MQNVGLYSLGQALLIMGIFNKVKEKPKMLKWKPLLKFITHCLEVRFTKLDNKDEIKNEIDSWLCKLGQGLH